MSTEAWRTEGAWPPETRPVLDAGLPPQLPATPNPPHRPSGYSRESAERILDRVAETNDSLRKICKEPGFPSRRTVGRWLRDHPEFREAYVFTSYLRAEDLLLECIEIVDERPDHVRVESDGESVPHVVLDKESLEWTKMRLMERHIVVAKIAPKRFGDKAIDDALPALTAPTDPKLIEGQTAENPIADAIETWRRATGRLK